MSSSFHTSTCVVDPNITFHPAPNFMIDGKMAHAMALGDNARHYMDNEGFDALFCRMMRYGIDQGILCPAHPGDCSKVNTDCCSRYMWECQVNTVTERGSGDRYRECAACTV